jgi:hypothetical protein
MGDGLVVNRRSTPRRVRPTIVPAITGAESQRPSKLGTWNVLALDLHPLEHVARRDNFGSL